MVTMANLVTMATLTTHEEHSHEEDPHETDDRIQSISTWNQVICGSLLAIIGLTSFPMLLFDLRVLVRGNRRQSGVIIMLGSCLISLVSYGSILPMTFVGLSDPNLITESFCYVVESLTFMMIMFGLFNPALLSVSRMDTVVNHSRHILNAPRTIAVIATLLALAATLTLAPVFLITKEGLAVHEHGCHMWSNRVDTTVWYQFFGLAGCLSLSCAVMMACYCRIYCRARSAVSSVDAHQPLPATWQGQAETTIAHARLEVPPDTPRPGPTSADKAKPSGSPTVDTVSGSLGSNGTGAPGAVYRKKESFQSHRRVALIASAVVMSYIIFWTPWLIVNFLIAIGDHGTPHIDPELRLTTMVIGYIPAATDPIMYAMMSPRIKKELRLQLRKLRETLYRK